MVSDGGVMVRREVEEFEGEYGFGTENKESVK